MTNVLRSRTMRLAMGALAALALYRIRLGIPEIRP